MAAAKARARPETSVPVTDCACRDRCRACTPEPVPMSKARADRPADGGLGQGGGGLSDAEHVLGLQPARSDVGAEVGQHPPVRAVGLRVRPQIEGRQHDVRRPADQQSAADRLRAAAAEPAPEPPRPRPPAGRAGTAGSAPRSANRREPRRSAPARSAARQRRLAGQAECLGHLLRGVVRSDAAAEAVQHRQWQDRRSSSHRSYRSTNASTASATGSGWRSCRSCAPVRATASAPGIRSASAAGVAAESAGPARRGRPGSAGRSAAGRRRSPTGRSTARAVRSGNFATPVENRIAIPLARAYGRSSGACRSMIRCAARWAMNGRPR